MVYVDSLLSRGDLASVERGALQPRNIIGVRARDSAPMTGVEVLRIVGCADLGDNHVAAIEIVLRRKPWRTRRRSAVCVVATVCRRRQIIGVSGCGRFRRNTRARTGQAQNDGISCRRVAGNCQGTRNLSGACRAERHGKSQGLAGIQRDREGCTGY